MFITVLFIIGNMPKVQDGIVIKERQCHISKQLNDIYHIFCYTGNIMF